MCRNGLTGDWYSYDDATVKRLEAGPGGASPVVSPDAYILFFRRRAAPEAPGTHWVYRTPGLKPKGKTFILSVLRLAQSPPRMIYLVPYA